MSLNDFETDKTSRLRLSVQMYAKLYTTLTRLTYTIKEF